MVLLHDTLSHCALALTVYNLQSGQKIAFSYVTRGII